MSVLSSATVIVVGTTSVKVNVPPDFDNDVEGNTIFDALPVGDPSASSTIGAFGTGGAAKTGKDNNKIEQTIIKNLFILVHRHRLIIIQPILIYRVVSVFG